MKKYFTKTSVLLIAASMLLSGCNGGKKEANTTIDDSQNVTASGELPVVKEPISLTIGLPGTPKVEDFETNAFTKYLEEKTGIDINFYTFASSGASEKLNVMLGSNSELPEVLIGFKLSDSTFMTYSDEGVFLPLNDYIERYGKWTKEMFEKSLNKDAEKYMISPDGNMYWMPYFTEQRGNEWAGKAWINKAWLDKLGLEMPKTTEDLRDVLRAFKTQDPNGNGKADEIGFTGSKNGWNESALSFLTNSFVYDNYGTKVTIDDNQKVGYTYYDPNYQKALEYINELVKEDLFDIQSITQDNQTLKSLAASEDVVLGCFASGSPDVLHSENMERLADYVALPPLEGPDGVAYAFKNPSVPRCAGVITKYCKNPVAAFRLMDFMLSEEASLFARYGVEGTDWTKANENDKCVFDEIGVKARINQILPYGATQNSHWNQLNPQFRFAEISEGMTWDGNVLDGEYIKAKALGSYMGKEPKYVFSKYIMTSEEQEEYNELYNTIHPYSVENVAMFVTGRRDPKTEFEKFREELNGLGMKRYIELTQIGYDRFIGKE